MFSFALWDSKRKKLILARDRVGIKPLYYNFGNGKLIFSSELKALLQWENIRKEIDFNSLHDYLTYMYVPAPDTIFGHVRKLEPGHMLVCRDRKIEVKKYWDLHCNGKPTAMPVEDETALAEKTYELVKESIKLRLISDVPLGVFLSGGLDSAAIVAIASEVSSNPIKTFSMGFEDDYYNELPNARLTARKFGTEHHEFIARPISIEEMQEVLCAFDEPFADSSAIPTYYLSRYARENATVVLSGDGGDEVFGGYGNYKADKIGLLYERMPASIRTNLIPYIRKFIPDSSNSHSSKAKLRKVLHMASMSRERRHIFWLSCFSADAKRELYTCNKLKELLQKDSMERYSRLFGKCCPDDFINDCISVDVKTVLPDDYLTKVDRMSMANSLEVRVPFLDHKLLEFVAPMSSRYKLRGFGTKYLLKKMMKGRLPEQIIQGRKMGFSIPLARWFREDFSVLINELLSERVIKKRGYFNFDFVKILCDNHLSGKSDNSKELWTLICFEMWHRKFLG